MIRYGWEPLKRLLAEPNARDLLATHWIEGEPNADVCRFDPDWPRFLDLEKQDLFRVWTARDGDTLAGYLGVYLQPHLHYRGVMHATTDSVMLASGYRGNLWSMLRAMEGPLREMGVRRWFIGDRPPGALAALYTRLGFSCTEHWYAKIL